MQQLVIENKDDLRAMVTSTDAFPGPSVDEVRRIKLPVLLLSGTRTVACHRLIDDFQERTLANCTRVVIEDAGHEMWSEQPERCRTLAAEFIERIREKMST